MGFIADTFHLDSDYKPRSAAQVAKIRVERVSGIRGRPMCYWRQGGVVPSHIGSTWCTDTYWCVLVPKTLIVPGPVLKDLDYHGYTLFDLGSEVVIPHADEGHAKNCSLMAIS